MLRSLALRILCAVALLCAVAAAQQPDPQLPDAPQQQPQAKPPQAPPPQPPPDEQPAEDKKPDSKIKRTLKRGAPNCIHIGGAEKCKTTADEEQEESEQPAPRQPKVPNSQPLPRSSDPDESSSKDPQFSRDTRFPGDISSGPASDVMELHPYNPHKADKDVEVGDFYFKRYNYGAAESRYAEALEYMPNHAAATYKLAEAQEKLGKRAPARENYEKYLKILPSGEFAAQAKAALSRLDAQARKTTSPPAQKPQ
jgi:tetratricopeptide (TPR) repeat protein